jgi:hypothetical protein
MKKWKIIAMMMATVWLGTTAQADDFNSGLHGMKWGSAIGDHPNLVLDHQTDLAAYYVDNQTVYQVSNTQVDRMVYGFFKGQLFAGFIDLRTPVQFVNLKNHFSARFGTPVIDYGRKGDPTVYRWKTGEIKIKLKMQEARNEMKLAIYYLPLSSKLNEAQLENAATKQRQFLPIEKGKTPEMVPLFNF